MGKRILNRKDLRADYDAAERRKADDERDENEDEVDTEEDEEEAAAEDESGAGDEEDGEPAPKKKPAKPKAPAKPRTRTRSTKVTRMKVVWGVFNNSNQCVATFDYPRRQEAEEMVTRLMAEKKTTHFLQPVKEPLEEKEK
jgi:hypothetical protein